MKKLIIELTEEQAEKLKNHLATQNKINADAETFSGYTIMLHGVEWGLHWLEVEMNSKLDLGDVNWRIE